MTHLGFSFATPVRLLVVVVALRSINYHTQNLTYKRFFIDCSQTVHPPSEHKDKHGFITSQYKHNKRKSDQLDILKLLCKFPAYNDRSRSWFKLKERSARDWKFRSTKVDAGNFKRELLNRLRSSMAVNVLKWHFSSYYGLQLFTKSNIQ